MTSAEALEQIKAIVGPAGWRAAEDDEVQPWLVDSRSRITGKCALFVRPASTDEVSRILALCNDSGVAVVPQGGNTSRVGGATPSPEGDAILLNLGRMNAMRELDSANYTITVEAGCILQHIQAAAEEAERFFPLSLGAEGSCQIGGNLATNAGGINVLRYGNARDLVLGLEVVLPDGEVITQLTGLRKDNTGYDLKNLFIGSEGTLGIITAAVLKLFPKPVETATAFCALAELEGCLTLLDRARAASSDSLSSFELIPGIAVDFATRHIVGCTAPLSETADWHVLLEFAGTIPGSGVADRMETMLEQAFEAEVITDAMIAQSGQQRADLWRLREAIVEAQALEGASIKHDVSVPVSRVPDFLRRAAEAVEATCAGTRPYAFGHVGDGNIHYNLSQPVDIAAEAFLAREDALHDAVHDITHDLGGSFSAEHGVGQIKRAEVARYKSPAAVGLMRRMKAAIDPNGIMNPGKLLPS